MMVLAILLLLAVIGSDAGDLTVEAGYGTEHPGLTIHSIKFIYRFVL